MALKGNLSDFSLPDVFQLIQLSRKTGVLRISRAGSEGTIWFREGEVFFATSDWRHDLLGQRLVAEGRITANALARALAVREAEPPGGRRLGAILVEEGYLTQSTLETFVQEQIQDTIFDLMRWDDGAFFFEPLDEIPPDEDIGLSVSIENIVMEGSRRLEEWNRIRRKIPSMDMVFRMSTVPGQGTYEISLKPSEWRLLLALDGSRSVSGLAEATGRTDFEAARALYGLYSAGLLELADDESVATATAERERREARLSKLKPAPATAPAARKREKAAAASVTVEPEAAERQAPRVVEEPAFLSAPVEPTAADVAVFDELISAAVAAGTQPSAVEALPETETPPPAPIVEEARAHPAPAPAGIEEPQLPVPEEEEPPPPPYVLSDLIGVESETVVQEVSPAMAEASPAEVQAPPAPEQAGTFEPLSEAGRAPAPAAAEPTALEPPAPEPEPVPTEPEPEPEPVVEEAPVAPAPRAPEGPAPAPEPEEPVPAPVPEPVAEEAPIAPAPPEPEPVAAPSEPEPVAASEAPAPPESAAPAPAHEPLAAAEPEQVPSAEAVAAPQLDTESIRQALRENLEVSEPPVAEAEPAFLEPLVPAEELAYAPVEEAAPPGEAPAPLPAEPSLPPASITVAAPPPPPPVAPPAAAAPPAHEPEVPPVRAEPGASARAIAELPDEIFHDSLGLGDSSVLGDELTALTGAERMGRRPAPPPVAPTSQPASPSGRVRRDTRVDRATVEQIIEGLQNL